MGKARTAKRRRLHGPPPHSGAEDLEKGQTNPAVSQALSIDLILMGIFKNLTSPELLICSSVNKVWNFNARTMLREKRMCCAKINGKKPCKDLARLDKLLGKSVANLPFYGIFINTDSDSGEETATLHSSLSREKPHNCAGRHLGLTDRYPNILQKFTLKNLKISWVKDSDCPAVQLLKRLFQDKMDDLERLEIVEFPFRISNLRQAFRINYRTGADGEEDDCWLPMLKCLVLSSVVKSRFFMDNFNHVVKELVLASPQLQEIYGITPNLLEVLFYTNKVKTVKEFRCWPNCVNEKLCFHFALEKPQLKKLIISPFGERPTRPTEIFVETFKLLLRSCYDTLTEIDIEIPYFMLMCDWDVAISFPRVRKLSLGYYVILRNADNAPLACPRNLNLNALFPHLHSVEIHPCSTLPREILNNINDEEFRNKLKQYCFEKVTTLYIQKFPQMSQDLFIVVANMFPNVKQFTMTPCDNLPRYLSVIWNAWSQLQTLTFAGVECRFLAGQHYLLESVFCGLPIEEVAEIQHLDSEFLGNLHCVPEQASLSSLKRLKTIRIEILHRKSWKRTDNPTVINLFYLSNHLAFSRTSSVVLEIALKDCKTADPLGLPYCYNLKFQHLKPIVKFVTDSSKWDLHA